MKIGICGDQHWTGTAPINRIDDYRETVMYKLRYEMNTFLDNGCEIVCFPGDLFDTYKTPYSVCVDVFSILNDSLSFFAAMQLFCVYGQHDQRYHTLGTENTPLGMILAATPNLYLADGDGVWADNEGKVRVYGASWGEPIPEVKDKSAFNILITHRMVIGDKKLWEGQEDYVTAKGLLVDTPYDLIITGDNHQRVIQRDVRGRALVNMGSMMRSSTAQYDHKPAVAIFDTDTKDLRIIDLPIRPSETVFAVEKVAADKERNEKLDLFINALQTDERTTKLDFSANLAAFVAKNAELIDDGVRRELKEMLPTTARGEL